MAKSGGEALQILGRFHRSSSSPSPSPDRAEGFDKYACFRADNYKGETEWYVFNVSSNDLAGDRIEPVPERPIVHQHRHWGDRKVEIEKIRPFLRYKGTRFGCFIVLGSFLYRLGGVKKEHCKVRCLDITGGLQDCWTKVAPMLTARTSPHAVVLDGKLYVMGGTCRHRDDRGPWAEVFDPCSQKWEPLPTPPAQCLGYVAISAVAALDGSKRIVLSFDKSMIFFIYDVMTNCWKISHHELVIRSLRCVGQPVVVGDILYWCSYAGQLYVYDFKQNMRFFCSIRGLEEEDVVKHMIEPGFNPSLFHLGGDVFGLLWTERDLDLDLVRCQYVKFRVSKGGESGNLLNAFIQPV